MPTFPLAQEAFMCRRRQHGRLAFSLDFAAIVVLDFDVAFEVDFIDLRESSKLSAS